MEFENVTFHFEGHEDWIDCDGQKTYLGEHWYSCRPEWTNNNREIKVMVTEVSEDGLEAWVELFEAEECKRLLVSIGRKPYI